MENFRWHLLNEITDKFFSHVGVLSSALFDAFYASIS